MPNISVWGLANECDAHVCQKIKQRIVQAVIAVTELEITSEKDVTCRFPLEMVTDCNIFEVTIEVTGLFTKPERTDAVRGGLATALGEVIERSWGEFGFPKPDLIECFIHPFDRRQGFWSSVTTRAEKNKTLHVEVVTGIVQIMVALKNAAKKGESFSFQTLVQIGYAGKSDHAQMYILEFIKDGIINLKPDSLNLVAKGDYLRVWNNTNKYLKHFGHDPIDPVPITL